MNENLTLNKNMNENQIDPKAVHTAQLCDPKLKLTARHRRRAMRARFKIHLPTQVAKDPAKKLAEKLLGLSCCQLLNFIRKSNRRVSAAKHLLAKMEPNSRFFRAVQVEQGRQLAYGVAARSELEHRQNPNRPHDTGVTNDNCITGPTS